MTVLDISSLDLSEIDLDENFDLEVVPQENFESVGKVLSHRGIEVDWGRFPVLRTFFVPEETRLDEALEEAMPAPADGSQGSRHEGSH